MDLRGVSSAWLLFSAEVLAVPGSAIRRGAVVQNRVPAQEGSVYVSGLIYHSGGSLAPLAGLLVQGEEQLLFS